MSRLAVAIGCLTILPFGPRGDIREADLGGSLVWFPLVGLLIGAGLVGVSVLTSLVFPPLVVGACVLLAWVAVTGALHLDGVGDVCDGLYGGRTPEECLRMMKDPHVGAMAVVAIVVLLLMKFALLGSMPQAGLTQALLISPCLGRYAMVLLGTTLPSARSGEGLAGPFVQHGTKGALVVATAVALTVSGVILGRAGCIVFGLVVAGTLLLRALFQKTLGGITGDAFGAAGEVTELFTLAGVALAKHQ